MQTILDWKDVTKELPRPDSLVLCCYRNKNKPDGITLTDPAYYDGEEWHKDDFWEDIVMWAYPTAPKLPEL